MSEFPTGEEGDERRAQSRQLVEKLLNERAHMLVLFCRAAGLDSDRRSKPVEKVVQEFCQLLVDYVAAGHFAVYERIVNGKERRERVVQVADEIYPDIATTTTAALDFNDKYESPQKAQDLEQFTKDLSRLGEYLATRIELEDKLLKELY